MADRSSHRPAGRVGALVLLGTLVVQLGWLLALPPFAGIDEIDHVFRASSVSLGDLRPDYVPVRTVDKDGRGDLIPVRADIARAAQAPCRSLRYNSEANCTPTRDLGGGQVLIGSSAARYDPAFYLVTGYLARPFHGDAAVYVMRIVGAVLSALLLGWTAAVLTTRSRTVWPVLTLLTAATPIVLYSTTVASPNGLHTVSAFGLWTALLGLFTGGRPDGRHRTRLLALGAVCGSVMLLTHSLAGLWLALTAVTVLALAGPREVWIRVRAAVRPHLAAALVVVLSAVAAVGWILVARTNDPSAEPVLTDRSPFAAVTGGLVLWPLQAIAAFPSREQVAAPVVYVLVLLLVALLFALALTRAARRERWVVATVVVVSFVVPIVLTVATYSRLGAAWQGRYGIPYSVGALLVLGAVLDRRGPRSLPAVLPTVLLVGVGGVLALAELYSWTSTTHTVLRKVFWRMTDRWDAPGFLLLLLLAVVAAGLWSRALVLAGGPRDD